MDETDIIDPHINYMTILAVSEYERRGRIGESYESLVAEMNKNYKWYRHCAVMWENLWKVINGEITRLMIFMPPRHGKSLAVSQLFPAAYLFMHPDRFVGLASYGASLAFGFSKMAREYYSRLARPLRDDFAGVEEWRTLENGGMWSAGVGGPVTGRGAHVLIVDDPVKGPEEAFSPAIQERNIDWHDGVWWPRQEPGAAMIVCQTRWCDKDLAGHLLATIGERGEPWHVLNFPAIAEEAPPDIPPLCTIEPDWRKPGEPLCEQRMTLATLELARKNSGRFWWPIYQQRATAIEGDVWRDAWFKEFDIEDVNCLDEKRRITVTNIGYDWDLAYTKKEKNSACAYIRAGRRGDDVFILDVDWQWTEFPAMVRWMQQLGGPNYVENKASGKSAAQTLRHAGTHAREVNVGGTQSGRTINIDKEARARLASVAAETGHVYVARHIRQKLLRDPRQGILAFPNGQHDDVNDLVVQAINRLWHRDRRLFYVPGVSKKVEPREASEVKPDDLIDITFDEAGNMIKPTNGNGRDNGNGQKGEDGT